MMFKRLMTAMLKSSGPRSSMTGLGARRRFTNCPVLLSETAAADMAMLAANHAPNARFMVMDDDSSESIQAADLRYQRKPGKIFHQAGDTGAIAVIPLDGVLVHKLGSTDPFWGMTGYDGIAAKLQAAVADPEVRGILLDVNSPGGEVDGVSDLAQQIAAANEVKPVWAIADAMAYSAAYWLSSQCAKLYMSDTAGVGSVGVVMAHADWSKALDDVGVKVTLIHAGAHKVDGNPYAPLPDAVREAFQVECEDLREKFAKAVASGRNIKIEAVLATEAACLTAATAVEANFADGVMSSFDIVQAFLDDLDGGDEDDAPPPAVPGALAAAAPQTSLEYSMTDKTGAAAPVDSAAAKAEGATEAKARIKAITGHAEAEGRETLAQHLAFDTDMTVDAAVAVLKSSEKRTKQDSGSRLGAAMSGVRQPAVDSVDPDQSAQAASGKKPLDAAAIYSKRAVAMGQTRH